MPPQGATYRCRPSLLGLICLDLPGSRRLEFFVDRRVSILEAAPSRVYKYSSRSGPFYYTSSSIIASLCFFFRARGSRLFCFLSLFSCDDCSNSSSKIEAGVCFFLSLFSSSSTSTIETGVLGFGRLLSIVEGSAVCLRSLVV